MHTSTANLWKETGRRPATGVSWKETGVSWKETDVSKRA
jgi:hypothetical protein